MAILRGLGYVLLGTLFFSLLIGALVAPFWAVRWMLSYFGVEPTAAAMFVSVLLAAVAIGHIVMSYSMGKDLWRIFRGQANNRPR